MERVYRIETPENLTLAFERAGLATRAIALTVDVAVMGASLQIVTWSLGALEIVAGSAAGAVWLVAAFLVQWGYGATCEWRFGGRTLGKRICGICAVDASGLRLSFAQAVMRNLLRLADLLPGFHLLGAIVGLLDEDGRRIGDLAARSVVVRDRRRSAPGAVSRRSPPMSTPRFLVPIVEALRPEERRALEALCEALEYLPLGERFALCSELAAHLSVRHGVAIPTSVSPEGFLLSVHAAASRREQALQLQES